MSCNKSQFIPCLFLVKRVEENATMADQKPEQTELYRPYLAMAIF